MINIKDKVGLDVENGKYKITGTVFTGKVFKRKPNKSGKKTNIVPNSIGYRIQDMATGDSKLVTKEEALYLVQTYGCRNAYVMVSDKSKYDSKNNLIKEDFRNHLQPSPSTKEAFTQDDRLVNVYKFDDKGEVILLPEIQLNVKEEDCTEGLWEIIQLDYADKEKKRKEQLNKTSDNKEDLSRNQLRQSYLALQNKMKGRNLGI